MKYFAKIARCIQQGKNRSKNESIIWINWVGLKIIHVISRLVKCQLLIKRDWPILKLNIKIEKMYVVSNLFLEKSFSMNQVNEAVWLFFFFLWENRLVWMTSYWNESLDSGETCVCHIKLIFGKIRANESSLWSRLPFLLSLMKWYFVIKIVLTYCEKKMF